MFIIFSWALLFFLLSPQFALAAPTGSISNNASYSLSASLAILFTFLVVLIVLVVLKHIYMKRRRARSLHCNNSSSSLAIGSQESSDSSMLSSLRSMTSKDGIAAFLVGFFGSPFWETSAKAWRNSLSWKESTQSSFMYSLHVQSRSHKGSRSRPTFNEKSSSSNEFGEKDAYNPDFSDSKQSNSLSSNGSLPAGFSVLLPTAPGKARRVPSKHGHDRRLSLPNTSTTRKADYESSTRQKRHSSLKSSRSQRSDSSIVLSPGLRMVYTNNSLEIPLPLSPEDHRSFPSSISERKSDQSDVPPLPPLPPITPLLPSPVEFCNHKSAIGRSYISHPYALAPYTKKSNLKQTLKNPSEITHDQTVSKAPYQSPPMTRSSYTFIPLPPPFTEIPPVPPVPLPLPLPPCEPVPALPKARLNNSSMSVRSRKSPPIGPSPLRIMTLPESVISNLVSLPASQSDPPNINEYQEQNSHPTRLNRQSYSNIGLGFPPSCAPTGDRNAALVKRSSTDSTSPKHVDDDGSNLLLGMIRELVEETSQWDTSLYMDDKFKSMIETAGSEARGLEKCESVASPVEVDLGLLGLEVFRGQFGNGNENTDMGVGLAW
ncbi:uncharacterized protein EV420DRAFT_463484 [Desarmillaria tabescens]|uniref:Defect at low temperature protein 1 n=1 Tax=Armillaria tabescens TaxID=1929756 RepID=A0AA39NN02_ARMTA|nr:uncharacterized protein EV420DRAFT_463484 [Desarmillaria tabescens]KAK0468398.1 hypothetical protein EV420DRAFT_463484 [Desarmillaria tabescens]